MRPIIFKCRCTTSIPADDVCSKIADTSNWSDFKGYAFLPGVRSAEYEIRTENLIGSRIRVVNTDGSSHVEEIEKWVGGREIGMRMEDFSPPLSRLATHFIEEWEFYPDGDQTLVERNFSLYPKTAAAKPALWVISLMLRRAINLHLSTIARNS